MIGTGSLWCDGLRIYEVSNMGMRLVERATTSEPDTSTTTTTATTPADAFRVTVNRSDHPQLVDHAIDGVPVVPVAFVIDWFVQSARAHAPHLQLVQLSDLAVLRGIVAGRYLTGGDLDLAATVCRSEPTADGLTIALELRDVATGRLHYRCSGELQTRPSDPSTARRTPSPHRPTPRTGRPAPTPGPRCSTGRSSGSSPTSPGSRSEVSRPS